MKIARVNFEGEPRAASVDLASGTVSVQPSSVSPLDLLTSEVGSPDGAQTVPLADVTLLAPIEPPVFRDFSPFEAHVDAVVSGLGKGEIPEQWYKEPFFYFTNPHALSGPEQNIELPPFCTDLDFELEVGIVIGKDGRNLSPEEASDYIAGYTIFNDWSARDLQHEEMKIGMGVSKAKDFSNTIGPWIVTPDEVAEHQLEDGLDLDMWVEVNGKELGRDSLANMAWNVEELISQASRGAWLKAGDVLGSGTCQGGCLLELRARFGTEAYPYLTPGDVVSLNVEGIGTLTNRVVAGVEAPVVPRARKR